MNSDARSGNRPLEIALLYNEPTLARDDPDWASEAGVLEAVEAVQASLTARGHHVWQLPVGRTAVALANHLAERPRTDLVFNLCEGLAGTGAGEANVAGLLELCGLPFTGGSPECLALVRDKARTKWLLLGAGLPTPPFFLIPPGDPLPTESFEQAIADGAWIVKPAREDASLGISAESVVTDLAALRRQVEHIRQRYGDVLIERFVEGREFNAGIVALPEPRMLPLAEIIFEQNAGHRWQLVTYDAKWTPESADFHGTPVQCPADVEPALARELERIALAAFRLSGCRDYGRVDMRVTPEGQVFILEINANPDISPSAGFARALRTAGIEHDDFIHRLVDHVQQTRGRSPVRETTGRRTSPAAPAASGELRLRGLNQDDIGSLVQMVADCRMFRADEIEVAEELLREAACAGERGHYQVVVAAADGAAAGWACYGLIPLTDGSFDLYWIVVDPARQSGGIGRRILAEVERRVSAVKGRWLIAETSTAPEYAPTQAFYERTGFEKVSVIEDFYRAADGRAVFAKRLDGPLGNSTECADA
jgi:D-alanine-D-alanine ligase